MSSQNPQQSQSWYDNKPLVVVLCVVFFPVGLYALWKNQQIAKKWKIGVTVIIGIIALAVGSDNEEKRQANEAVTNTSENTASISERTVNAPDSLNEGESNQVESDTSAQTTPKVSLKEQLERELKSLTSKSFDGSGYRETIQSIQIEVALFDVWAKMIKEAEAANDPQVKQVGKQLEYQVKLVQLREFPQMRKAYKKIAYQKLWLENIETSISGYKFTTLEFTGGAFASNKNKQSMQTTLTEILKMLRFKKVNYKFTKYDSEYTYYTVDSPKDNEIVRLSSL
ncbi:hypothetical protein [uncultured Microscilla sp.]|uniref:hypothetical protein n=1 Tax=uncultured Microscilla sp. TaxID=432653 RepID=UPI00262E4A2C|nr:hypothetical protein [uncultured Microscilla sp.]